MSAPIDDNSHKGAMWILAAAVVIGTLIMLPGIVLWVAKAIGFLIVVMVIIGLFVWLDSETPKPPK